MSITFLCPAHSLKATLRCKRSLIHSHTQVNVSLLLAGSISNALSRAHLVATDLPTSFLFFSFRPVDVILLNCLMPSTHSAHVLLFVSCQFGQQCFSRASIYISGFRAGGHKGQVSSALTICQLYFISMVEPLLDRVMGMNGRFYCTIIPWLK